METDSFINQTSLTGEWETGAVSHSFSTGIEYAEEKMRRGSFAVAQVPGPNGQPINGTHNPASGNTS